MSNLVPLNDHWRVAHDGTQWLLQRFHENDGWRARACCHTRQALERCLQIHVDDAVDPAALAILAALPDVPGLVAPPTTIAAESGECDDDYPGIVARLNGGWRIVAAPDGTQWILQRQRGAHRSANDWRARSHCRTRYALERCVGLYAGDVDPAALAILAELPGHIDWGDPKPPQRTSPHIVS
jgi:hypothetical protein